MVGGPGAAMPGGATLFGLSGPRLRQLGIAFLIVGFLLFLLSFIPIFLAINNFMANPFGSTGSMFGSFFLSFLIGALGIVMIGIGGFALRLGLVRPPRQLRRDGSIAGDSDRGDGVWGRHSRGRIRSSGRRQHPRAREVPQLRIPRDGRRGVLQQVRTAPVRPPGGSRLLPSALLER